MNRPVEDGYNYRKGIFTSYVGTPNFGGSVDLQEAVLRNQQKAKDAGAQFLYETKAVRLVHNDDNTEVTGVICEAAGGDAPAGEGEAPAEGGDAPAGEGAAAEGEAPAGEAAPEK